MLAADHAFLIRAELAWFEELVVVQEDPQPSDCPEEAAASRPKTYQRRARQYMQVEQDHQGWLDGEIRWQMKAWRSAGANERKKIERQIEEIGDALALSRFAYSLFFAIETSLNISTRDHVFGVRRFKDKEDRRSVRCQLRPQLPRVLMEKRVIMLDGTADPELVRLMFPGLEVREHDGDLKPGAYRLTQYTGHTFSKSMFVNAKGDTGRAHIRRLLSIVRARARQYRRLDRPHSCIVNGVKKDVLVVCQLPVQKKLEELGLPENVAVEHFNDIKGDNNYRDVPCGIVVGRSSPSDDELELLTEAFHFDNPNVSKIVRMADWTAANGRYRGVRKLPMADGRTVEFSCEAWPDRLVDQIFEQLVRSEVAQAVHRLRVFDRKDSNPADIHLFADVDVGLPVHEVLPWMDAVSTVDEMAAGGVVFERAAAVMQAYPEVFDGKAERTVQDALAREIPIARESGALRDWQEIEFRVEGQTSDGRQNYTQIAFVDPTDGDPGQTIAAALKARIWWRRHQYEGWRYAEPHETEPASAAQESANV